MNIMNRMALPPKDEKFRIYPHIERERVESTNCRVPLKKSWAPRTCSWSFAG